MRRLLMVLIGLSMLVPAATAFDLTPADDRIHPHAVEQGAGDVRLFLRPFAGNDIVHFFFVGNTWMRHDPATETTADRTIDLDPGGETRVRWVVETRNAVVMDYRFRLTADGQEIGRAATNVLLIPGDPTAVTVDMPVQHATIPDGATVTLHVQRRMQPDPFGLNVLSVAEHLYASHADLPVAG